MDGDPALGARCHGASIAADRLSAPCLSPSLWFVNPLRDDELVDA